MINESRKEPFIWVILTIQITKTPFNSDTIDRVVKPTVVRERLVREKGTTKEQMMTMRNEMVVSSDDITKN